VVEGFASRCSRRMMGYAAWRRAAGPGGQGGRLGRQLWPVTSEDPPRVVDGFCAPERWILAVLPLGRQGGCE
jgi:hypothetical protein